MQFKKLLFNAKLFSTLNSKHSFRSMDSLFSSTRTYREEMYASRRVPVFNPNTTDLAIASLNSLMKREQIRNELSRRKRFIRPVYARGLKKWEGRQRRFNDMYKKTVNDIWYIYQSQK